MQEHKLGDTVLDYLTNRFVKVIGVDIDLRKGITVYHIDKLDVLHGKRFYNELGKVSYEIFH